MLDIILDIITLCNLVMSTPHTYLLRLLLRPLLRPLLRLGFLLLVLLLRLPPVIGAP